MNRVITKDQYFRSYMLKQCLRTHSLTEDDLRWGSETVDLSMHTPEQLATLFLSLSLNTDIGRFSLLYSDKIYEAITTRDLDYWVKLLQCQYTDAFPEYYHNAGAFTDGERRTIIEIHQREYLSLLQLIKRGETMTAPYDKKLLTICPFTKQKCASPIKIGIDFGPDDEQSTETIYQKCYNDVCLQQCSDDYHLMGTASCRVGQTVQVPDVESARKGCLIVHCVDFMNLIASLTIDHPLHPVTHKPFDPNLLQLLKNRYRKEILLYGYYLNHRKL